MEYDKYIVAFSGGKDSTACFLHLLDSGIPKNKIELWHHLVDGKEETFMDWEVTEDYCRKFAKHFGVDIYFSWKEGGFKREMLRENELTAPTVFEIPYEEFTKGWELGFGDHKPANGHAIRTVGGKHGKKSTRRKFPQISPDLSVRWCSAYLKIDICATGIRNQKRFDGLKTCVISGERGEESKARSNYAQLEADRADLRNGIKKQRYIDRLRPIRDWSEKEVWDIIEKHKVIVHPCYYMGWSRCSCKYCIFGNADQFASAYKVSPEQGNVLIDMENYFGVTMKRDKNLSTLIQSGNPYGFIDERMSSLSKSKKYYGQIITESWALPAGAYGESCGPS
ncbi:MAG: phosphoadenosine phosphosulfate reductase family protein [Bacteroidota bacterium]